LSIEELNVLADSLDNVYKNRGYITIEDVQTKLDDSDASLVETNQLMRLLLERGCKVTECGKQDDDLSFYDGSQEIVTPSSLRQLMLFYKKENKNRITGLDYAFEEYDEGLIYYSYLRLLMKLSKVATIRHIVTLQEAYNMFLDEGEDKAVFAIQSAAYIQKVSLALHNRKQYKKIRAVHKGALAGYQIFLTQNMHKVIAACESQLTSKV